MYIFPMIVASVLLAIFVAYITYSEDKVIYNELIEYQKKSETPAKEVSRKYEEYKKEYSLNDFKCKLVLTNLSIMNLDEDLKNRHNLDDTSIIKWKEKHPKSLSVLEDIYKENNDFVENLKLCVMDEKGFEVESIVYILKQNSLKTQVAK